MVSLTVSTATALSLLLCAVSFCSRCTRCGEPLCSVIEPIESPRRNLAFSIKVERL
ncbi:hypothetical protein Gbem_4135 [Citrifermentans bemidjiense Bem]|uniref:Uncharacterized protein n=1 Tax=Citrifermentans bemidjiense (strain ATCC BAA-1014 / DSM 16622 / JCM 12645 / Bem) TaxID=404380 RepID=E1P6D6_CITBB|nr:hypothetical protein Gbem_4135 [Citrifermentans bemidjiense Bem]